MENKTINKNIKCIQYIIIIIIYVSKRSISTSNTNIMLKPSNKQQCSIH